MKLSSFKKTLIDYANETQKVVKPLGEKISTIDKNIVKSTLTECYNETINAVKPLGEKLSHFDDELFKSSCKDLAAVVSKVCVGYLPLVGPILSEVVGSCMQKQEMDRVFNYMEKLENRLSFLENKDHIPKLSGFSDLIVQSCRQATESINEKRQEYIASIVSNGIAKDSQNLSKVMKMLETFKTLKDTELEILRLYGEKSSDGSINQSIAALDGIQRDLQQKDNEYEFSHENSIYHKYIDHLTQLNLLQYNENPVKESYGQLNKYYAITLTGENLLAYMGA
jgi:hypothetical protein